MDERREMPGRDKPQKTRNYSWLVTKGGMGSASKAEMPLIRSWCLTPPEPPFAICLATSGQKQLLYRTPVNLDTGTVSVCLEGDVVTYAPGDLAECLDVANQISAAAGKMILMDPITPRVAAAIAEHWGLNDMERIIAAWSVYAGTPLANLAAFLALNKKDASERWPKQH